MYTWTYDASTGTYKCHALSKDLLKLAVLDFQFVNFTKKVNNFGKKQGDTVTMPYYKPVAEPTSAQLDEKTRIPIDKLQMGVYTITIKEWGRGVEFSSLAEDLSALSPKEGAQQALLTQMNSCMDTAAAAAFTGTNAKIAFIPTSLTGGVFDTDGTPSTQATVNMTKDHMGVIRDYLANTIHAPFYESNFYIGIFATKALRGLKNDKILQAFNMYLRKGDILYANEVGMVENIRCVECTHENALSNSIGASSVLGEGVVFGDSAVGRIEVETPHLRADLNYQGDFGRIHAVVWYGTVAFDVMFQSATDREARIIKIASA
ncbi:MAG: hypothetical protein ABFD76_05160 [Smithella sp.]